MTNMSYCRFENTLHDLIDCQNALWESNSIDELMKESNDYESKSIIDLIKLCVEISDQFKDDEALKQ